MDALLFANALEHAHRTLRRAEMRLVRDRPFEQPMSPRREEAETRIRAEVARLAALLDQLPTANAAGAVETAAEELDIELAALGEADEDLDEV